MSRLRILLLTSIAVAIFWAQTPVVREGSVLNAASFTVGQVITPGSLISIFGTELAADLAQASSIPLSTTIADVSVTFNGIPAPLTFVAPQQINAQLPWNVMGQAASGNAVMVVRRGSATSQPVNVPVGPASPGIFSLQSGEGQAIAINANGSLAAAAGSVPGFPTEPAPIGSTIVVLGTGFGAVDPPAVSGNASLDALRRTMSEPEVLIGGRAAAVAFSGLAPQFVGVNQLNVTIPDGVAPGNAVPIQIRMGGITTSDKVIIAVSAR